MEPVTVTESPPLETESVNVPVYVPVTCGYSDGATGPPHPPISRVEIRTAKTVYAGRRRADSGAEHASS